ncbi:hypothetical protein WJX73_004080 [Symbiochloris irregularis]|uniref:Protein kinase domain-containing protein n=1 Tax=Symbiochloris irregularis TaxID=706552 RepID=A0AAW1P0M8_9CHLO
MLVPRVQGINRQLAQHGTALRATAIVTEALADISITWGRAAVTQPVAGQFHVNSSSRPSFLLSNETNPDQQLFSGAACAVVDFAAVRQPQAVQWFLVEHTTFSRASYTGTSSAGVVTASICSGNCSSHHIPLLPNTTYQVVLGNAGSQSVAASYNLTTHAANSPVCAGLQAAQVIQPAFRVPASFADGLVTGRVINASANSTATYTDLFAISNASCALMGIFAPSIYATNLPRYTMHLAFSDPGVCASLAVSPAPTSAAAAFADFTGTSIGFVNAIRAGVVETSNTSIVVAPIKWNDSQPNVDIVAPIFAQQYHPLELLSGGTQSTGYNFLLNITDNATASYIFFNEVGYSRALLPQTFQGGGTAYTAGCARLSFQGDCSDGASYLLANTGPNTLADIQQNLTVYAPGAPECAGLPPPQQFSTANTSLVPLGSFNGTVTSYIFSFSQGQAAQAILAAYANVSCIFLAIDVPSGDSSLLDGYRLSLVPVPTLANQIAADGSLSLVYGGWIQTSQTCNGTSCNAAQDQWLFLDGLEPSESYYLVAGRNGYQASSALPQQEVLYLSQALSSEDQCVRARQNPQASPYGFAAASSASPPPVNGSSTGGQQSSSTGSSSSTGAVVGGVVGGIAAACLLALAALLFARRRRRQRAIKQAVAAYGVGPSPDESSRLPQSLQMGNTAATAGGGFLGSHGNTADSQSLTAQLLGSSSAFTNSSSGVHMTSTESSSFGAGLGKSRRKSSAAGSSASDNQWYIEPASLEVCRHDDGTPFKLGQGGFGSVYKALQNGVREVAVKISETMQQGRASDHDAFWREIELIAHCRDRNVLQFYGAAVNGSEVLLVTEFCERGDLYHAIAEQGGDHIDSELCWYRRGKGIALDVARGLFSLHSRRIVHFDVKSPNVLLTNEYLAKVADVGLAHPLLSRTHLTQTTGIKGTWAWQAPETITGTGVTTAADIWSFGVIMWELMTGERPQRGRYRTPRVPEEGPQSAVDLMRACMEEDPELRPTAGEIIRNLQKMDQ